MDIFSDFFLDFPFASKLIFEARSAISNNLSLSTVNSATKAFIKSNELIQIVNRCLRGFEAEPGAQFPFMGQNHIILCSDFDGVSISVGRTQYGGVGSSLYTSPSEVLLCAASSEGFPYQKNKIPENWNCEIFSNDIYISDPEFLHCNHAETVLVSTKDIFDYRSTGELVLKIAAPTRIGLMWEFDRDKKSAKRVFASTIEATTKSYIMKFLSEYGNSDSVAAISKMKDHPFHYLRWDVAKALGQLDESALIQVLGEYENDIHPHIRRATAATLAAIGDHHGD